MQDLDRETLAALLAHLPASLLVLQEGVCVYANDAARRLFDREMLGERVKPLLQYLDSPTEDSVMARIGGRVVRGFEYRLPHGLLCMTFADVTGEQHAQREALAQMASGLTWGGSLDETMASLARNAAQAVDAVAAIVILLEKDRPRIAGSHNLPPELLEVTAERFRKTDWDCAIAEVIQSREIVIIADLRERMLQDPALASCADYLRRAPWDVAVKIPMFYRDAGLGTLNCFFPRREAHDGCKEEERRFLQAIADQAAVLVQNARLLDELRGKALLEERHRLARELHDSVSQALYGIALGARTARTLAERDPGAVVEPLDYVLSLAEAGLAEMRALIFELRPETIDSEGLIAALERQVAALHARHQIEVQSELPAEPALSSEARHALYRVAQEALQNIVKHADATHVDLRLRADGQGVALLVADDGRGFDGPGDVPGHLGLRSMRERMASVGGALSVESAPGRGTRVLATLPAATA